MSISQAEFGTSVPAVVDVFLRGAVVPLTTPSVATATRAVTKSKDLGRDRIAPHSWPIAAPARTNEMSVYGESDSKGHVVEERSGVRSRGIGMYLGQSTSGGFDEYDRSDGNLREKINCAAYPLFRKRGIKDVSLEEIQRDAGVSPMERKRVFRSKRDIAQAFLDRRDRLLMLDSFEAGARHRGATPEERLLAIFDVVDDWFHRDDYDARSFIRTVTEMDAADPVGQDAGEYLLNIRAIISVLGSEAHLNEPAEFAVAFHRLVQAATVLAVAADFPAARRLKALAQAMIIDHRQQAPFVFV